MKLKVSLYALLVLTVSFFVWLFLPVLSPNFIGLPLLLASVGLVGASISAIPLHPKAVGAEKKPTKMGLESLFWTGLTTLSVLYIAVGLVMSAGIFTWETKKAELNLVDVTNFDTSVPNVDMSNLVILDEEDARRTSEKLITEKDPTMGSQYQIGVGTLSVVNGKPYWIFPMEHRGVFKWLKNKGTIPGYLKVSATNFNDAQFVDMPFAISPSGYLNDDLKRLIYSEYPQTGLTDYSFEIDDQGKPFWVVTAYTNRTWLGTPHVRGTIVVDPILKDMTFFEVGKQPEWVDRVYAMSFFAKQLDWYGSYVNGWWNPSDSGKLQDTEGMGYVFNAGNLYFYTGMTSVGKDNATTGFMIFNPRNGEAQYHRISGSVELKAVGLMEELVQNSGYKANFPYLINLNGEPTYFSTLKGNSGNVVGYAFASVQNYKAVAWSQTLREAQTAYGRALLREGAGNNLAAQTQDLVTVEGLIERVGVLSDGYYILKTNQGADFYIVNSEQFPVVALSAVGDRVKLVHLKSSTDEKIDVIDFMNNSITK